MGKNIVIFSDGTGNSAIKGRGTNVFKLFEAVDCGHPQDPAVTGQVAFYDDGVGTQRLKPLRLIGGAFGWGLSRNVKQLYAALARSYVPGDRIFLFGFSRGAFTVRTLAGFVLTCGILDNSRFNNDDELWDQVNAAYGEYRRRYRTHTGRLFRRDRRDEKNAEAFRKKNAVHHPDHAPEGQVTIAFIGVWDTVSAVGLPLGLNDFVDNYIYRFTFPDFALNPHVHKACHALSIDDERKTFHPLIWDEKDETRLDRVEQVWFPGVHSNVGGGYPKQGLSLVALHWMIEKAALAGLRVTPCDKDLIFSHQNSNDKLYDSRSGIAIYYRYQPRDIGDICRRNHVKPKIHVSAIERIVEGITGYAPGNIPPGLQVVSTDGNRAAQLHTCSQVINAGLAGNEPLVNDARKWVTVKGFAYIGFVFFSAAFIVAFLKKGREHGFLLLLLYAVMAVVLYMIGWWAGKKRGRIFSEFWKGLSRELRKVV